jgi:hypothetical protein
VKRIIYVATAALVAMLVLMPGTLAQSAVPGDDDPLLPEPNAIVVSEEELESIAGQPLPKTGGPEILGTPMIVAAALLLGSGVLAYAMLRRRST